MESDRNNIYLMKNYKRLRRSNTNSAFKMAIVNKNNICPLKPEFRQYANKKIVRYQPKSTIKSVLMPVIIICAWSFAMCLLAKSSYDFLQAICIHSVQEIKSDRFN